MRKVLETARLGFWCNEVSERSSNYRELRNLVEHIRQEAKNGSLTGKEVWIYTDNQVAESVWYKGTSTERTLFELMLELRMIMVEENFILHVVHVAGTRLIGEGTDGLSRGEIMASALLDDFSHQVPTDEFAIARSEKLKTWLGECLDPGFKIATPIDWFRDAQHLQDFSHPIKYTTWVWDIPPAAAPHILEEIAMARTKRHETLRGLVLIPRLMQPWWIRRFTRTVDFYFVLPAGTECWPKENHEPVYVGVILPLLRYRPWDWSKVPFLVGLARTLSTLYATDYPAGRDLLREFWKAAIWIQGMPERLVSGLLQDPGFHKLLGVAGKGPSYRR
jgi:hypothetical protein